MVIWVHVACLDISGIALCGLCKKTSWHSQTVASQGLHAQVATFFELMLGVPVVMQDVRQPARLCVSPKGLWAF